ncbi:MAG TPA: methyl-accepting chemotaxis protein [Chloroflexota bacterium]|nr:methyl-accepting chemotaxis protein [Chloroflexota bacterium]
MSSTSIRSTILGAAAVAAILDAIVVIVALVTGPHVLAAILALGAGVVCFGGASFAARRAAASTELDAKQLERANSQIESLTRQLNEVADYLSRAETGEIGSSTIEALSAATQNVELVAADSASQLQKAETANSISAKLAETVETVDKATKDNLAATENVIHAVVEISRALEETATNAQKVAAGSEEASSLAQQGEDAVRRTIQSISLIRQTVLGSAEKVQQLAARANQIGDIVKLIDDIADQTNLLALNAAIEAARAGEQGKGFAVVASEVRKLAERTSRATKEIGELIKTTQDETAAAVEAMHVGSQEVEEGSSLGAEAGNALQQILDSVARNNEQVQNISAAVEEMTAAANEIVNAVESQGDKFKANTGITAELLQDLEQLSTCVSAVTAISRDNATSINELAKLLHQSVGASAQSSNGDLRRLAEQLKETVGA